MKKNGGNQWLCQRLYLIAQAWRGASSLIAVPSFLNTRDACCLHEHKVSFFSTGDDLQEVSFEGQDFCWICNLKTIRMER